MKKFIAGIIFATVGLSILDSISVMIASVTEIFKGKCALKVTKINNELSKSEETETHSIGFEIPKEEDDYDED